MRTSSRAPNLRSSTRYFPRMAYGRVLALEGNKVIMRVKMLLMVVIG